MKRKNNFIKNGALLLFNQQTDILSAALIIMINVVASKILGLFKRRLLVTYFGSSSQLAVYVAAFRLPDIIFQILVMGALTTAFIPVITKLISKKEEKTAWQVASSILNIGLVVFSLFALVVCLLARPLSQFLAPGFNSQELDLMANLTRIMLAAQFFFILSNFLTGILQSFKRFMIPALAPVMYNIGIILAIIFLSPSLGIYGPTWGVVLGTILHFAIQLPLSRRLGLKYKFTLNWKNPYVKRIWQLMGPRLIGLGIAQIDYTVDLQLATLISASSVVYLDYGLQLQLLPVGLIGATIAQAALPSLAEKATAEKMPEFKKTFLNCLHQILFFVVPFSVLLIILRVPIVRLVYGASRFNWEATVLTSLVLAFFGISIFAQSSIHLLTRTFYALHDAKTPVTIGAFRVAINVLASLIFVLIFKLPVWSLGLSTSVASILNFLFLLYWLNKKVHGFDRKELLTPVIKIFGASFLTAFALYVPMKFLDQIIFDTTRVSGLLLLTGITTSLGVGVYFFLAWIFKIKALKSLSALWSWLDKMQKEIRGESLQPVEVLNESVEIHP